MLLQRDTCKGDVRESIRGVISLAW